MPKSIHAIAQVLKVPADKLLESPQSKLNEVKRLRRQVEKIIQSFPQADPENVWHTLILLKQKPIERLQRALQRGSYHLYK